MEHTQNCFHLTSFTCTLLSWILYLETVTLVFCNADINVGCMSIEMKALLKFKEGLTDHSDRLSSWAGEDYCKWRGVGCNSTTGRVGSLNLRNSYSDGTIHALEGERAGCGFTLCISHSAYMSSPCHIELTLSEKEDPVKKELRSPEIKKRSSHTQRRNFLRCVV